MSRLFLIRHGQPDSIFGHGDHGLSEGGKNQAEVIADRLFDMGRPLKLVSSPMFRCQHTAAPAARRLKQTVSIDPRIKEIRPPDGLMMAPNVWIKQVFQVEPINWRDLDDRINGWRNDVVAAASEVREDTAMFTHFMPINAIVGAAQGSDATIVCLPEFACMIELSVSNGVLKLVKIDAMAGKVD